MEISTFYKELFEDVLGLNVLGLEYTYRELVKMIDTRTILAFSNCVPARYKIYLDLRDGKNMVKKDTRTRDVEFYIHDDMLDKLHLPILGIKHIEPANTGTVDPYDPESSAYYSALLMSRQNLTLEGVLFGSEYTYNRTLVDSAVPFKRSQEMVSERVVRLRNWGYYGTVEMEIYVPWPYLSAIPSEYKESFMRLAELDCQAKLWHQLKFYEDVVTPTGNLNLRMDWSNAARDREEFLRDLRSRSLPERTLDTYFTIL